MVPDTLEPALGGAVAGTLVLEHAEDVDAYRLVELCAES
jgi:hypothetical protein